MDRKKLNEILDKHVQKFFKKAPTARFNDVPSETFIDAMEEAINYTRCCEEDNCEHEWTRLDRGRISCDKCEMIQSRM
jgi:hypothetical protein